MIELTKNELIETNRKSSKGNQFKWYSDGFWYKADQNGYEGLSECVVSRLLKKTNLEPEQFVSYDPVTISYDGKVFKGCRSRNFLKEDQRLITLQRLYQSTYEYDLAEEIDAISSTEERCRSA